MSKNKAFSHLITASQPFPILQERLNTLGPLWFPDRRNDNSALYLARSIVGQQVSVKAAQAIWGRVEQLAQSRGVGTEDLFVPENVEALRSCGVSYSKAKALCSIHAHYQQHGLNDDMLQKMGHLERSKSLIQIWGVGQWTVDMVSIFFFQDPDIWPLGDGGIQRGMNRIAGRKLSAAELQEISAPFAPWRSILSLYTWRVLDLPDVL